MSESLESLRSKLTEQEYLVDCLEIWKLALDAGYPSETVKAFGFRKEFLSKEQQHENTRWYYRRPGAPAGSEPFNQFKYHNCVILKDGRVRPIKLVEVPLKPVDMV